MDDSGLNLSLNLLSGDAVSSFPNQRKGKVQGTRRERVKQRKEAKRQKASSTTESSETAAAVGKKRKHEEEENRGAKSQNNKKSKGPTVISSLFRKNPEIPFISNAEVKAVEENVFTADAFKDLPLHPHLISNLEEKQGFKQLTEVQKRTIPVLLSGKDALVKSQTGSGKTVAYAVPVVQTIQSRKLRVTREDGPYALVIVPTRELALQSFDLFQKLLRSFVWIVPGCLMGGEKKKAEKARLRKGINILVATPGRLLDHINTTGVLSLKRIRWLIIDEADRLLELGYERDIAQILNSLKTQCPDPPQTVLLSATLSQGVERLSSLTLNDPERISVSGEPGHQNGSHTSALGGQISPGKNRDGQEEEALTNETYSLPSQLRQLFMVTPCKLRLVLLAGLVLWKCKYSQPSSKMIVFLSTQDSVEFHATLFTQVLVKKRNIQKKLSSLAAGKRKFLDNSEEEEEEEDVISSDSDNDDDSSGKQTKERGSLNVFRLHGDMVQKDRSQTFHDFTNASSGVLFCTDVAARGLDLPLVDWIVQYTSPGATVDYIHRVGRTARAGSKGHSLLFLMPSEAGYVEELNRHRIGVKQFEQSAILKVLLDRISDLPQPETDVTGLSSPRTQEEAATYLQDRFEECLLTHKNMHGLAAKGFQSYIRAYATYSKEVKDIFKVSNLHLGHVAKSFALREAPAQIHDLASKLGASVRSGGGNKYKKKKEEKPSKRPLSFKQATLSEYSSGFQQAKRKVMAKPGGKMKPKVKKKFNKKKSRK